MLEQNQWKCYILLDYDISLEKSVSTWQFPVNKVIKFGPRWEATPTCLWDSRIDSWRYRISWENGGRNTKTPALIAVAPFPFPLFRVFLPPPPLPFLRLPRRLDWFAMHQAAPETSLWQLIYGHRKKSPLARTSGGEFERRSRKEFQKRSLLISSELRRE